MATEKWVAGSGVGLTWTAAFSTEINSLASGYSVLSSVSITNGTALDIFADVSLALGSAALKSPYYIGLYLYPLNQDGSTYGDNRLTTTGANLTPSATYWAGNIIVHTADTTTASYGQLNRIIIPPGTFSFAIQNQVGVTMASSGNDIKYRTYNRAIA